MGAFVLLADPKAYQPCHEDMRTDVEFRAHWLGHFEKHFEMIVRLAIEVYGEGKAANAHACRDELVRELRLLEENPARYGELNLLVLDILRQQKLFAHDIPDPFEKAKARENDAMLKLYPQIIAELDAHTEGPREMLLLLVEGMFAGNIFDLGVTATADRFKHDSPDFCKIRDELGGKRPWLVDQFDAFAERMLGNGGVPPYRKMVFFLDNAGSDCVLGVIPFARHMAKLGVQVVLAANRLPALNDVTHTELREVLRRAGALDGVLRELVEGGRITVVESGGIAPLIDLRHVSDAVNAAAADADLVVLEGMGRGLESNFHAAFKVDAVKLCMIKDPMIAKRAGGEIYDCVFRFDGV